LRLPVLWTMNPSATRVIAMHSQPDTLAGLIIAGGFVEMSIFARKSQSGNETFGTNAHGSRRFSNTPKSSPVPATRPSKRQIAAVQIYGCSVFRTRLCGEASEQRSQNPNSLTIGGGFDVENKLLRLFRGASNLGCNSVEQLLRQPAIVHSGPSGAASRSEIGFCVVIMGLPV